MNITYEKACLCALGKSFGFKPGVALALISHFGSAEAVFGLGNEEIRNLTGPFSKIRTETDPDNVEKAYQELISLERHGIYYTGWTEDAYPPLLKECEDAPVGLYIRSETDCMELWKPERKISVVGTRDISLYGKEWCEKIVAGLASSGTSPLIISGLALGTDICAHKTALDCGIPTIGVMATGPESIYPSRNEGIAKLIARTPGCALITDYPPGTAPLAIHFLRRNRIIAGLAEATILVESKIKGGGMMTSRLAQSYNRDVYALPGRIDDLRSQGCNLLIRKNIAQPMISTEDLLESLGMKRLCRDRENSVESRIKTLYGRQSSPERVEMMLSIINEIKKERGVCMEDIAVRTGLPFHHVSNLCGMMESDGLICTDLFQRCSIKSKKF